MKRGLSIRGLVQRLILTLTRKIRMKTAILTILNAFKLRASIITLSVTLATHALSIMLVHVSPSVLLVFECLDELANCGSTSGGVDKCSEVSGDVLVGEGELILNALNVDQFSMA